LLDPLPDLNVHDSRMKAVMGLPFVAQPSDIDWVRQDPVEVASRDQYAAGRPATPAHPRGGANVLGVESGLEAHHAAEFEIAAIEGPDELSLAFNDVEGAVFDQVAERDRSAHPDALPFRRGDLIADSLAGDFALELGERQQHVESKPSHAGSRVEGLGHRDERDGVRVE
jgi:hypothetical protein